MRGCCSILAHIRLAEEEIDGQVSISCYLQSHIRNKIGVVPQDGKGSTGPVDKRPSGAKA